MKRFEPISGSLTSWTRVSSNPVSFFNRYEPLPLHGPTFGVHQSFTLRHLRHFTHSFRIISDIVVPIPFNNPLTSCCVTRDGVSVESFIHIPDFSAIEDETSEQRNFYEMIELVNILFMICILDPAVASSVMAFRMVRNWVTKSRLNSNAIGFSDRQSLRICDWHPWDSSMDNRWVFSELNFVYTLLRSLSNIKLLRQAWWH